MAGGSQSYSPNSHRKSHRNVLRVSDICQELQSDCKNYCRFVVVEEFSGLGILREIFDCWAFCLLETVTADRPYDRVRIIARTGQFRYVQARRICPLQIQNKFYNRFAFVTNIRYSQVQFDETFCRKLVNNFDCRAFSLFISLKRPWPAVG